MKFEKVDIGLGNSVWVKDGGNYTDLVMLDPVLLKNTDPDGTPRYRLDSFINRDSWNCADWGLDDVEWRGDEVILHRSGNNGIVVLARLTDEILIQKVLPIVTGCANIRTVEEFREILGFDRNAKA